MFPAWMIPIFKAVAINTAKNTLTGQDPLRGSVEAGVTGGVLGGFDNGNFFNTAPTVSPTSAGAFEASMGLNNAYNAGSLAGLPGSGTIESVLGPANAAGTFTNQDYFANILGNQVYTGNDGLLSQIGTGANSIFDSVKTELGDSLTPQNLLGVGMLLNNIEATPRMPAAGGGVRGGGAVNYQPISTATAQRRKKRG